MITIELRKLRHLKIAPMVLGMLFLLCLFNIGNFGANRIKDLAAELSGIGMIQAFLVPILIATITTRIVEIEHSGGGWQSFSLIGAPPGTLCRTKFAILTIILIPFTLVEILVPLAFYLIAGGTNFKASAWVSYILCVIIMNLLTCMVHIILAHRYDNQLVSIGVGTLGAFLAMFSFLLPRSITRFIPWGYYALILPATASSETHSLVYINPGILTYLCFTALTILITGGFYYHTTQLNKGES